MASKYLNQKWRIEFSNRAVKSFDRLDSPVKKRITEFFDKKIVLAENPRIYGKQLTGPHADKWSYRVGDYRILAQIKDEHFTILAVDLGHRRQIYKKML